MSALTVGSRLVLQHFIDLRQDCERQLRLAAWIEREVAESVGHADIPILKDMVNHVATTYPACRVPGLITDIRLSMLYRVEPDKEHWFNDGIVDAVCERLVLQWPNVQRVDTSLTQDAARSTVAGKAKRAAIAERFRSICEDDNATVVVMPVNFSNMHWCGVIVDRTEKLIKYYDSLTDAPYGQELDKLVRDIAKIVPAIKDYCVVHIQSPIQQDSFSCGFFTCLFFWRSIDVSVSRAMTVRTQTALRFGVLKMLLGM